MGADKISLPFACVNSYLFNFLFLRNTALCKPLGCGLSPDRT